MKILLRKWDDKYYVWKDATWSDGSYSVDGVTVQEAMILSVKRDSNKKYVRCANCNAIIEDSPESIEKHFAEQEAQKDCHKCTNLRAGDKKNTQQSFEKNDDGTYHATITYDAELKCARSWPATNIDTIDLNRYCSYYACRNAGVKPFEDIFAQYPDPFNKQITVDLLREKGFEYEGYNNGYFEYDLKLRNTLKACVNELGIVDHFKIIYRYNSYTVCFSENHNELFYITRGKYTMHDPYSLSETKHNSVKAKISALYKEAIK